MIFREVYKSIMYKSKWRYFPNILQLHEEKAVLILILFKRKWILYFYTFTELCEKFWLIVARLILTRKFYMTVVGTRIGILLWFLANLLCGIYFKNFENLWQNVFLVRIAVIDKNFSSNVHLGTPKQWQIAFSCISASKFLCYWIFLLNKAFF